MLKSLKWISMCWMLYVLTACTSGTNTVTTESGVVVNYVKKGTGVTPEHGEVMTLNMTYQDENGETLFETAPIGAPVPIIFDTINWKEGGMLYEVFSLLKVGDSITFDIPASDLFEKSFRSQVPDTIGAESNISFMVGMVEALSRQAFSRQQQAEQYEIDGQIIDEYLADNNIEATETESGLRYVINEQGSGPSAEPGANVVVHYTGTLLDGTKFDSSHDRGQPFSFVLGQGRVIQGWDEGIALLNKGAKATLYIPSPLAYGQRGAGPQIGPNSVLKFDVELVDIQ